MCQYAEEKVDQNMEEEIDQNSEELDQAVKRRNRSICRRIGSKSGKRNGSKK